MDERPIDVGIIGGSGFYRFLDHAVEHQITTPYGEPSDRIVVADVAHRRVAFLPRHGRHHTIPPHRINYRANIWALKSLGVRYLISPCAVGSLQAWIKPEHFVVCDQYVDRTRGRLDTFCEGPDVFHVSAADPYCPNLRKIALEVIEQHGIEHHATGTIVVINGPRFSTKAESRWYTEAGFHVIGMTQYPEAHLALEQEMAVVNISLVTDYDCGLVADGDVAPVTAEEVRHVFERNSAAIRQVVLDIARAIPADLDCPAHHARQFAGISA
ncbi:MAG: S-methyl-5'-thioadenosine phosphorylase [Chthonomonadales bacterium]|nr:S-methyl-5'-thioadenosine phosphorylase [Chthonomonadales bacterium]